MQHGSVFKAHPPRQRTLALKSTKLGLKLENFQDFKNSISYGQTRFLDFWFEKRGYFTLHVKTPLAVVVSTS